MVRKQVSRFDMEETYSWIIKFKPTCQPNNPKRKEPTMIDSATGRTNLWISSRSTGALHCVGQVWLAICYLHLLVREWPGSIDCLVMLMEWSQVDLCSSHLLLNRGLQTRYHSSLWVCDCYLHCLNRFEVMHWRWMATKFEQLLRSLLSRTA